MNAATTGPVLFPGTFDPITFGHLDVIRRAVKLFSQIIIGVGENPAKAALLDQQARVQTIRETVAEWSNVSVQPYAGLTVDFARQVGAVAIVRGLRNSADLHSEFQMAMSNRAAAGVETIFIMTAGEYAYISSSLVRQLARNGADVSAMVPAHVVPYLQDAT